MLFVSVARRTWLDNRLVHRLVHSNCARLGHSNCADVVSTSVRSKL